MCDTLICIIVVIMMNTRSDFKCWPIVEREIWPIALMKKHFFCRKVLNRKEYFIRSIILLGLYPVGSVFLWFGHSVVINTFIILSIRRLWDLNHSGWWIFLIFAPNILSGHIVELLQGSRFLVPPEVLLFILWYIVIMLYLLIAKSAEEPNQFDADALVKLNIKEFILRKYRYIFCGEMKGSHIKAFAKKIVWNKYVCIALICLTIPGYIVIEEVLYQYDRIEPTEAKLKQAFAGRRESTMSVNKTYLEKIIPEYSAYEEKNRQNINRVKKILNDPAIPWIKERRYVCGVDFAPGEYLAMTTEETTPGQIGIIRNQENEAVLYLGGGENKYFVLHAGDSIRLSGVAIAPVEEVPRWTKEEDKRKLLSDPAIHWQKPKRYVCGSDIAPGQYGAKVLLEEDSGSVAIYRSKGEKSDDIPFDLHNFFSIEVGDRIELRNAAIAPEAKIPNLAQADGILYEGGYRVGKDIAYGEYFTLSMSNGDMSYRILKDGLWIFSSEGFGYTDIKPPLKEVRFWDCIAIPIGIKPKILPFSQEPLILNAGTYLVGRDIPAGRYFFKFGELDIPDKQDYQLHEGYQVSNDSAFARKETEQGEFARNGKRTILRKTIWVERNGKKEESVSYQYRWPEDKVYIDVRAGQYIRSARKLHFGGETPQ